MPIATFPGELGGWVSLAADEPIDPSTRPRFRPRFPSALEAVRLEGLIDEAVASPDTKESLSKLLAALGLLLADWKGLVDRRGRPLPANLSALHRDESPPSDDRLVEVLTPLAAVLSYTELWQLYTLLVRAIRVTENDLKKSGSPSPSPSGPSVPDAPATAAAAGPAATSPTEPARS